MIVHGCDSIFIKFKKLVEKYVSSTGEYEINIGQASSSGVFQHPSSVIVCPIIRLTLLAHELPLAMINHSILHLSELLQHHQQLQYLEILHQLPH